MRPVGDSPAAPAAERREERILRPRVNESGGSRRQSHPRMEVHMAKRRKGGDERATRRDAPGGASAGPVVPRRASAKRASGQQLGSKRPAVRTGAEKRAPKKGEAG